MELKEGMYVRTKKGIFQITNDKTFIENKIEYIGVNGRYTSIDVNTVIKASHNIIDLIEVGDYVNGLKVIEVREHLHNDIEIVLSNGEFQWSFSKNDSDYDIKNIVTKEQFESMKYSLEG